MLMMEFVSFIKIPDVFSSLFFKNVKKRWSVSQEEYSEHEIIKKSVYSCYYLTLWIDIFISSSLIIRIMK